jgi:hypothetical protein
VNIILAPGKQHLHALCATFLVPLRRRRDHRRCRKVPRVCAKVSFLDERIFNLNACTRTQIWPNKSLLLRRDENLKRLSDPSRPLTLFTSGVCPFLSNFHAPLVNLSEKLGLIYLAGRVIIGLCGAEKAFNIK